VDFRAATVAGLSGLKDPEVLALAAREGRFLVTHDSKTMPHHFAEFVGSNRSAGVIVVPQHLPVSAVVDDLVLIWTATTPDDWVDRISYLPL